MIVSAAEDPSYEGKVRRTRARWLLDEQRELGGEPVEGQLLARAAREWPSESEEEWAEIAKLAMALETGTIPAAEGEKKLLRSVPTKRMIELAAGFFVECPEATYQQAYDWIAENHGRPAIKYSSWQASSARKAKTLAKRRAGGETPAPTQAPAETAPAAPEAATVTEDDDGSLRIGYGPYELVATPIDAGGKRWLVSFRGAVDASLVHSLIGEMLGNPHLNKIKPAGSDA